MRIRRALILAVALAALAVVTRPQWLPICATLHDDDPMYWMLGCWIDPPPKDPSA